MKQQYVYIVSKKIQNKESNNLKKLCEKHGLLCEIIYIEDIEELNFQLVDLVIILCHQQFKEKFSVKKREESFASLYILDKDDDAYKQINQTTLADYMYNTAKSEEKVFRIKRQLFLIEHWRELKDKNMRFKALLNNTPYMTWFKDVDSKYRIVNEHFKEHSGKQQEQIYGQDDHYVWNGQIGEKCREYDLKVMTERKPYVFDEVIPGKKGYREYNVHKAPVINESDEVIGTLGIARDITELKKAQEKIETQAYTDSLTKLANRRGLYKHLSHHAHNKNIHLLFIDLDDFKQVNDTCGHHYGDEVLKLIAKQLKAACSDGFMARMGGDEFIAVFVGNYSKEDLSNRAKRIIDYVKTSVDKNSYKYNVSASIGIVTSDYQEADVNKMLIKGDMALYAAKEKGKNQFIFYTAGLESERLMRIYMERDLSSAVENNEISLYYQPIYDCQQQIRGFESLFRWENNNYKDVSLDLVIDVIEKMGLMTEIGKFLLEKAFLFAKKINKNRPSDDLIVVTVNLSATQIMKDNFISLFEQLITKIGINPGMIGIEITETVLLENIEENKKKLKALKELGVTILLDDFGTGYSSLNYLVQLPISVIKIDKSFVWGMEEQEDYKKLTKLIIDAAHSLQMGVLGEGVETQEQLETLKDMGINYIQGYYYAKPLSEERAISVLKKREE